MGQEVLRKLLEEIRAAIWLGIIADEATDVSHKEQISISIRWVSCEYTIHEDTLCLVQLQNARAETVFGVTKIRCSLPISQCRGQAFDGASNMSGVHNGVQALIKKRSKSSFVCPLFGT